MMLISKVNIIVDGIEGVGYLFKRGTPWLLSRKIVKVEESRRIQKENISLNFDLFNHDFESYIWNDEQRDHSVDATRYVFKYQESVDPRTEYHEGPIDWESDSINEIKAREEEQKKNYRTYFLGDWDLAKE